MIQTQGLTKRYRDEVAVDDLTFDVLPGKVTGFLGPNGAGKTTTMRMILGLDHPTSGRALVHERAYPALDPPLRHVGALLEANALHPGRTARNHLRVAARSNEISLARVDEVLEEVGLAQVARRRVKSSSLGYAGVSLLDSTDIPLARITAAVRLTAWITAALVVGGWSLRRRDAV